MPSPNPEILSKKCALCELIKKIEEFNINKTTKDGFSTWCVACYKEYNKLLYSRDKEKVKSRTAARKLLSKLIGN